jgi:VWFA-related protein
MLLCQINVRFWRGSNVTARFVSALLVLIPWTVLPFAPALAAAPPGDMVAPPSFTEAVEVHVVNVDVRVTDANGKPVTGLRKQDFELFEDGKRVGISNFNTVENGVSTEPAESVQPAAPAPALDTAVSSAVSPEDAWTLVDYVDNFNIHPGNRTRAVRQVRDFLSRQLAPGDRVMLVTYDLGVKVRLPFTSDPAAIDTALREVEGLATRGGSSDLQRQQAFREIMTVQEASVSDPVKPLPCPLSISRPAHDFAELRRDEVQRTLGALTVLVNSLSGVPGRKAVLHVSDGIPAVPGEEVFQFLAELCGGGGGTAGLGRQTPVGGDNNAPENDPTDDEGNLPRGKPRVLAAPLDELAVYDTSALGPGSYKGASQAPIDAAAYSVTKDLDTLVAHANAQRVTLYMLQAAGAESPAAADASMGASDRLFQFASIDRAQRASLQSSLTALASGTGGRAILDANDLGRDLSRMREDFASYYSLGFVPAHKSGGGEHRLEVRVKRRGAQLRYRESYRDKPVLERAVDRTLAALFYGIEDNPMAVVLELGEQAPGPDGSIALPVRLRIPLFKVAMLKGDGRYEGNLRVLVATRSADGRMSTVRQIPVPIHIPHKEVLTALGQFYVYTLTLQLAPGEQTVAVGVRDEVAATTSYLSRAVNVGTTTGAELHRP